MQRAVANHLQVDYDTFRQSPDPLNLLGEVAFMRTLLVEVRESIEDNSAHKMLQFVALSKALIEKELQEEYGYSQGDAESMAENLSSLSLDAYGEIYGKKTRITTKEAVDLAKVVEALSKVVERIQKLATGIPYRVRYDNQVIAAFTRFIVKVVMPHVNPATRKLIAQSAKQFLPNVQQQLDMEAMRRAELEALPEVIEVEQ